MPGFQIYAENMDIDSNPDGDAILFASDSFVTYYDSETGVMYDSVPEISTFQAENYSRFIIKSIGIKDIPALL